MKASPSCRHGLLDSSAQVKQEACARVCLCVYLYAFACGLPEHPQRRTWLRTGRRPEPRRELRTKFRRRHLNWAQIGVWKRGEGSALRENCDKEGEQKTPLTHTHTRHKSHQRFVTLLLFSGVSIMLPAQWGRQCAVKTQLGTN